MNIRTATAPGGNPEQERNPLASANLKPRWQEPVGLALLPPVGSAGEEPDPPDPPASTGGHGSRPESAQAAQRAPEPPGLIRVLLADDHKMVRQGLRGLLAQEPDIEIVAEAEDGQQAVELAEKHRPHVVVMDISMPRMDGVEATRRILQTLPGVQIIALSMHGEDAMGQPMRDAGACDYVTKDRAAEDLVEAIRHCLDSGATP